MASGGALGVQMARLPPLSSMEAFLEVARLGSVKAAAAELALSTPALSRRIQTLERSIGKPLFDRHHQALRLTVAGEKLRKALNPVVEELRATITAIRTDDGDMRIRLNVLPLFAQQRLFPRLPELRARHPNLHIDVETLSHGETRLADTADAAIALARGIDPLLHAVQLDSDKVFPIAAKSLVDGPDAIRTPDDLKNVNVLLHSAMPETFEEWRKAIGRPDLQSGGIDFFDSGPLMLEAAAQGVGVAFMHGHHLDDAKDDRLVRLFDFDVRSPYSYWFVCRPRALKQPAVRIFHDWLIAAAV